MARVKKADNEAQAVQAPATLAEYIASREVSKLAEGIVLVRVTHPEAKQSVFPGRYSGIELNQGPAGCVWSDGSKE